MTRAAIYARYSSEQQSEASIEDQVRNCRRLCEEKGWHVAEVYADRALSGASTLRPGYQKLMADARRDKFEVVVAEGLDRLSREQVTTATLFQQLSFIGVMIYTRADGEVSELHVGLKGTMNALFLKDLALKTHRGIEGRVRQGKSGGGKAYGYRAVPQRAADGTAIRGDREIVEAEAVIVRRIFAEFAAGKSPRAIARDLNCDNIKGPSGKPWRDTTIRGHATRRTGILRNDLYVGSLALEQAELPTQPRHRKAHCAPPRAGRAHRRRGAEPQDRRPGGVGRSAGTPQCDPRLPRLNKTAATRILETAPPQAPVDRPFALRGVRWGDGSHRQGLFGLHGCSQRGWMLEPLEHQAQSRRGGCAGGTQGSADGA